MSEFNITVEGGSSVKLPTSGKYCDRDIVITATGSGGGEINTGTCSISITVPSSSNYYVCNENVGSDGTISYSITRSYTSSTISKKVRCDSVMYIQGSTIKGVEITDGELLKLTSGYGIAYRTPSTAGVTAKITLTA